MIATIPRFTLEQIVEQMREEHPTDSVSICEQEARRRLSGLRIEGSQVGMRIQVENGDGFA